MLQYTNVREAFSCIPKLNASIEQLCCDNYTSSYNLVFNVVGVDANFYYLWMLLTIHGAFVPRNMKRNPENQACKLLMPDLYMLFYGFTAFFRIVASGCILLLVIVNVGVPSTYKCSLGNDTAPIPFNQTQNELSCHDQRYKEKSNLHIDFLLINVFLMGLCIVDMIYLYTFTPPDKFLLEVISEAPVIMYSVDQLQGESNRIQQLPFGMSRNAPQRKFLWRSVA